jgi:hypothetical protein
MKKLVFTLMFLTGYVMQAFAYDFSAVCESGQTLYYRILSNSNNEVAVCHPNPNFGWYGYSNPEGDLVIPEFVEQQGNTYTVTSIDDEVFSYCHGITSVILPNSVTTIGNHAFSNIAGLSDFLLPNSVTNIGEYVFEGTRNIMNDVYNDKIFAYHPRDDQSSFVIPEGIEEIASAAFRNCDMRAVYIPASVTRIGKGAFSSTDFMETAIIPDGVTCIEDKAFFASAIRTITIPNSVTSIKQEAFRSCTLLDAVMLPNVLQSIGKSAFRGCGRLHSIVIPNSVTTIEECAFANCGSLTSFVLPDSVTNMGPYVFEGCDGFTEPVYNAHYFAYFPKNYATSYTIPDGVETILEGVFWDCTNLDSIIIPNSVKTIEQNAFLNCNNLTYVLLPETLETLGNFAFAKCYQLTTINLPNSVIHVGEDAFMDCQNLREPLFNDRFFVHFPKNYATTYSIPEGIEEVIGGSFVDCDSLMSVDFPVSVTRIRDYAISNCPNLKAINIYPEVPPVIDLNPFYPWNVTPVDSYINVPRGTLETYLNNQRWGGYVWCLAEMGDILSGREMYYEILNDDGSITYQHLEYASDTMVNNKDVKIIIRTNTLYDKGRHSEVSHEYIYEENGKVYWWNKGMEEFNMLYDFNAEVGDEWEIKAGTRILTMHVDAVEYVEYEGISYRMLCVSDPDNLFSGSIFCGIGHMTSFFPEKLMRHGNSYRVEGLRCYWRNGFLKLKYGDKDCDAVYQEYHNAIDESAENQFNIYPNPTNGVLVVETVCTPPLPDQTYRITNLMGQTLMLGNITCETQRIDVTNLPEGMYFITIGDMTSKFVVNR